MPRINIAPLNALINILMEYYNILDGPKRDILAKRPLKLTEEDRYILELFHRIESNVLYVEEVIDFYTKAPDQEQR